MESEVKTMTRAFAKNPYIISWLGEAADCITSYVGIKHFNCWETHLSYSPVFAGLFFTFFLTLVATLLPQSRFTKAYSYFVAFLPWLGPINNLIVMFWR
jgi:hypothetical protein